MKTIAIALFSLTLLFASATHAFSQSNAASADQDWEEFAKLGNQMKELSANLKTLAAQPIPAEYANLPAKSAEWNKQTTWLEGVITLAESHADIIAKAVKDKQITAEESAQVNAAFQSYTEIVASYGKSTSGPLSTRYKSASLSFSKITWN